MYRLGPTHNDICGDILAIFSNSLAFEYLQSNYMLIFPTGNYLALIQVYLNF